MSIHIGLVVSDDFDYGPDLASGLIEAGVSVTLYVSQKHVARYIWGLNSGKDEVSTDQLVEEIYARELIPISCGVRFFEFPRIRDPRSLKVARDLAHTIRGDGLDLVHILMGPGELWMAIVANLMGSFPVVSTLIIPRPNIGETLPRFVLWSISKLLILGSREVIVNGAEQVEQVANLYRTSVQKITHVPLIPRTSARKWADRNHSEEAGIVLFPGKAQPRKGLEYLIKAQPFITARVPHAKIVIAAHGEEMERCRAMIKDESKFELHDKFLTSAELAAFFQKASVVALPYISASTSGLLMTAYVFGKPAVTTSVGALPEYLQDGLTGYLVPPCDEKRLADAITQLLLNDEMRRQMGENARQWIESERSLAINKTIDVYQNAISN